MPLKPLGRKAYGSIPHLPGSRLGPGDHHVHPGQARIALDKVRDRHDLVIVQEKLDGSNCSVALLNGVLVPMTRAGWPALTSPYVQHHYFAQWVYANETRFRAVLTDGAWLVGEWLAQAHGTRYCIDPETPVLFADLVWRRAGEVAIGDDLIGFDEFCAAETNCRRWQKSTVLDASHITLPSYRIVLEDGTEFVSSGDHLWLVKASSMVKWTRTDQLRGSQDKTARGEAHRFPSRLCRVISPWSTATSWDAGYLAGVFDGEGSLSQVQRGEREYGRTFTVSFSQRENEVADLATKILRNLGVSYGKSPGGGTYGNVSRFQITGGTCGILRFLGQVRPRRLLNKLNLDLLGQIEAKEYVEVEHVEPVGLKELSAFHTTTKTFIANGFGSHNCLTHEPFVVFDLMQGEGVRLPHDALSARLNDTFVRPAVLHYGLSCPLPLALDALGTQGHHGALDTPEGCIWRVERKGAVDYLCKFVKPTKQDGLFLPELTGEEPVWNWQPVKEER